MSKLILWTLFVGFALTVFFLYVDVIPKDNLLELIEQGLDLIQDSDRDTLFGQGGPLRFWD